MFLEDGDDNTFSIYYGQYSDNKRNDDEGMYYYQSNTEIYVVIAKVEQDIVKEGCKFDFNNEKKLKHFNHFKIISEEEDFEEEDDMYETIVQSERESDLTEELVKKWESAKKIYTIISKETSEYVKIYNAARDAEKICKDIKSIDDFYNKYSNSKNLINDLNLKSFDKLVKTFPKVLKYKEIVNSKKKSSKTLIYSNYK